MVILRHDFEFGAPCLVIDGVEAFVRLDGDIDGDCVDAMDDVVGLLRRSAPRRIFTDLGGVVFAGAALANFLVRVVDALPTSSTTRFAVCYLTAGAVLRVAELRLLAAAVTGQLRR
ncbi:hypothetical protein Ais01nite_74690 [Asanoa ishikariensis]|uniref:STAS domain-containing protein n=1 Tax=Asanoa ishikariensis TaxID=137265 RepID=A0A1H3USD4_9ACTN|nr:hypothetical protein [Asanoa ishikariensis]GIF69434.1 hypothetical protein Ais01nite_74690 [Asanoa ishikariensis]SDZ65312.1 hypothetical protein SAMN05421684_7992 [Asanoa ishikariensis]